MALGSGFERWKPSSGKGVLPMRPNEIEIQEGLKEFDTLLDHLAALPSFQVLEKEGHTPAYFRRCANEQPGGLGHALFRPIGQIALAQALGELTFGAKKIPLDVSFSKLKHLDEK
ncbi:MAG: hypothetical protein ACLQJR_02485, partial [Stellaceae bacterium]